MPAFTVRGKGLRPDWQAEEGNYGQATEDDFHQHGRQVSNTKAEGLVSEIGNLPT